MPSFSVTFDCQNCGKEVTRKYRADSKNMYCANTCTGQAHIKLAMQKPRLAGKEHHNWRGGRWVRPDGYVMVLCTNHPYPNHPSGKYVFEHRLAVERTIGRHLTPQEIVHHLNGVRSDNRPENLKLCSSQSEHLKYHALKGRKDFQSVRV